MSVQCWIQCSVFIVFSCCVYQGWFFISENEGYGIEYVYYTDKHTWNEARSICHSIGGELAKIDSQQTIKDIQRLALEAYPDETVLSGDFWIGLYEASSSRRQWAVDCSELTFHLNYVEPYDGYKLCFKSRSGHNFIGYLKGCAEATPFLCEIHEVENCTYRYPIKDVGLIGVDGVTTNDDCQTICAPDTLCSAALFVLPSGCYKVPYNLSTSQPRVTVTMNAKFCASFHKNESVVTEWSNNDKNPLGDCGVIPIANPPVSNLTIDPSSSLLPSSTLVMTELVTQPCHCMTPVVSAVATVTQKQMTTVQPSMTPGMFTISPEIIAAKQTVSATQTLTKIELSTAILTQTTTVTLTEVETTTAILTQVVPTTVKEVEIMTFTLPVTATPSCSDPVISVTTSTETTMSTASTTTIPTSTTSSIQTSSTHTAASTATTDAIPSSAHNISLEEALTLARQLQTNLTMNTKKTSKYLRRFVCAKDRRVSSQAIGIVWTAFICIMMILVFAFDRVRFLADFRRYRICCKNSVRPR